ncbi:hypothetical protein TNCV_1591341 [Trichonephila clavipes]|nr:hypothetical protein TNCV_1591341 [Trichonephila clavipes]
MASYRKLDITGLPVCSTGTDIFVKLTSYGTVGRNFRYTLPVTVSDKRSQCSSAVLSSWFQGAHSVMMMPLTSNKSNEHHLLDRHERSSSSATSRSSENH